MSKIRLDLVWQHDRVLPYILGDLFQKISAITRVHTIYLWGSRARTPVDAWHKLEGKDWDVLVVCDFPIINTAVWTTALNYHIDLVITSPQKATPYLNNARQAIELYPNYLLPELKNL